MEINLVFLRSLFNHISRVLRIESTHSSFVLLLFFFSLKFRLKMFKVSVSSIDPSHCMWIGVLAMLSSAVAVSD